MIDFTTILSKQFWKKNSLELSHFFEKMENLEYWTLQENEIYPFLVFFEIKLNSFKSLSVIFNNETYFNNIIEIFSYFTLGTFMYVISKINEENSSFIISLLLNCKQENNVHEKLFIERFTILDKYDFLSKIFNEKKIKLIKTIIEK